MAKVKIKKIAKKNLLRNSPLLRHRLVPNYRKTRDSKPLGVFLRSVPNSTLRRLKNGIYRKIIQRVKHDRKDYFVSPIVRYRNNHHLDDSRVCRQRSERRRAIFSMGKQGAGHRRPIWNRESHEVRCS